MALDPIVVASDLVNRGVDVSNAALVAASLSAASEAVREAAGCAITRQTSTITVEGCRGRFLRLPGGPVRAVTTVSVDGENVSDWKLASGSMWRAAGWAGCEPSLVTVTYDHGFDTAPADIAWLVGDLAIAAINAASQGTSHAGVMQESEAVDDWNRAVTYLAGPDASMSVIELPEGTKQMLRARFGGNVHVVESR